jgi:hypothetical protein
MNQPLTSWLPPWKGDREAMIEFVIGEFWRRDQDANAMIDQWDGTFPPAASEQCRKALSEAMRQANRDNLEPLRRLISAAVVAVVGDDPGIAKFINAPPRRRYQHRPRGEPFDWKQWADASRKDQAVDAVKKIREIWRVHYGRRKRHREDRPSAEEIAGLILGFTEAEVKRAVKDASRR